MERLNKKQEASEANEAFGRFEALAKSLLAVPKHELDEEIAKEKAEGAAEKPARKPKQQDRKEAA